MTPSLAFFEWCEATYIGQVVRDSQWLFPVIESVHLLALAAIGGAVLIVDLRLFGLVLDRRPVAELAREAEPWLAWSLVIMLLTGVGLFLSEAVKCYYSQAFWVKMYALPAALVFAATARRWVTMADEARVSQWGRRLTGAVSLALWFTVGAAGRWIGFS
jgi:hypothetical protein